MLALTSGAANRVPGVAVFTQQHYATGAAARYRAVQGPGAQPPFGGAGVPPPRHGLSGRAASRFSRRGDSSPCLASWLSLSSPGPQASTRVPTGRQKTPELALEGDNQHQPGSPRAGRRPQSWRRCVGGRQPTPTSLRLASPSRLAWAKGPLGPEQRRGQSWWPEV